jgi:hypothetical protein
LNVLDVVVIVLVSIVFAVLIGLAVARGMNDDNDLPNAQSWNRRMNYSNDRYTEFERRREENDAARFDDD